MALLSCSSLGPAEPNFLKALGCIDELRDSDGLAASVVRPASHEKGFTITFSLFPAAVRGDVMMRSGY